MAETNDNETTQEEEKATLSVFITAGASAVGRAVTRQLVAEGHTVTAMVDDPQDADRIREDGGLPVYVDPLRTGEIKGMINMAQADVVLHLAPLRWNEVPFVGTEGDTQTLVERTAVVLEAARAAGVEFFVHTSFAFLYEDTHGETVDESVALSDSDAAILSAGNQLESMALAADVPACILRAGYVYGAYSSKLETLADHLRIGRPVPVSDHDAVWVHADDLARALIFAAQQQPAGEVFNIVDDTPLTPREFLKGFAAALGVEVPRELPGFLARALTPRNAATLLNTSVKASNAKAKDKLGWQPKYPAASSGIEQTLLLWRAGTAVVQP